MKLKPIKHPGRLLKRELSTRELSANLLALDIGVPSGRITDILNGRRSITADAAVIHDGSVAASSPYVKRSVVCR